MTFRKHSVQSNHNKLERDMNLSDTFNNTKYMDKNNQSYDNIK